MNVDCGLRQLLRSLPIRIDGNVDGRFIILRSSPRQHFWRRKSNSFLNLRKDGIAVNRGIQADLSIAY